MTQLPDIMLHKVCTEVQAINTHIRLSLTATQSRCRKSRFAILSEQWERNSKNSGKSEKKHWDFFFPLRKKSGKFMGPPTFFFYISMHSYQNTDKINPENPDNPKI